MHLATCISIVNIHLAICTVNIHLAIICIGMVHTNVHTFELTEVSLIQHCTACSIVQVKLKLFLFIGSAEEVPLVIQLPIIGL